MKISTLVVAFSFSCAASMGQGTLIFANFGGGVNAPITTWDGKLAGSDFMADLYWGPGIVTDSALLVPLGRPASLSGHGIFLGGVQKIPGAAGGTLITAQVRVWHTTPACVWDCDFPFFQLGASGLLQVTPASDPYPPPFMTGLVAFAMSPPVSRYRPQLNLSSPVNNALLFSWQPYAYADLRLQQNADLNTTNWVTVTKLPVLTGSVSQVLYQIEIPAPSGQMFYRLSSQ